MTTTTDEESAADMPVPPQISAGRGYFEEGHGQSRNEPSDGDPAVD